MTDMELKPNPTRRELRVFALLFLLFMGLLSWLCLTRPQVLLGAAAVTGAALLISFAFNPSLPRRTQLFGLILPAGLLLLGGLERVGAPANAVSGVAGGLGVVGAVIAWISSRGGKALHHGWMCAALPVGWSISQLVLAMVFYLVLTPIGLLMRLLGYDPMSRRFDPAAKTYWVEHDPSAGSHGIARYFRQF